MPLDSILITGICGQDGPYLARHFFRSGTQKIVGLCLPERLEEAKRKLSLLGIDLSKIRFVHTDLYKMEDLDSVFKEFEFTKVFHLASQSSVGASFEIPYITFDTNFVTTLNLLETIRKFQVRSKNELRFFHASSSEMFGDCTTLPINLKLPFNPLSPYASSKVATHYLVKSYRDNFNIFACNGIMFNHESYLRSPNFFVKKVIREAKQVSEGKKKKIHVGNIDVYRDFGLAPKYVEAMALMLEQPRPKDFIICSGQKISLREIINVVLEYFKLPESTIVIDQTLFRQNEIKEIYGDSSEAVKELKWDYHLSPKAVIKMLLEEEFSGRPLY